MTTTLIVSDFLKETAEEADIPEKGMIVSWSEVFRREITEEVIILDTKLATEEDKTGKPTVTGEETWDSMRFLRKSLLDLLDSGRTVIGLTSKLKEHHPRINKTYAFTNYSWISRIEGFPSEQIPQEGESPIAVKDIVDPLWSRIDLKRREEPYISYFLNVEHAEVYIEPEQSGINQWESFAEIRVDESLIGGLVIKSWIERDEKIEPEGNIVLLPRPTELRIEIRKWFRSLVDLGQVFSPHETSLDQYNRLVGRTHSPELVSIYRICARFPLVVRQLKERYSDRGTLTIEDEHDVQDLFHSLLKLYFDDVREEEWGPSYAGSSPRMDFLVKSGQISIEIKVTRDGRSNREIKNELSEDKEHYRTHPDCEYLVCYVYDESYEIDNPAGFERDLSEEQDDLVTEVIVSSTERFGNF